MKSINPGRGPSFMGGIAGIVGTVFALFWTVLAFKIGAPFPFPLFGIVFMVMMIAETVYSFKNATSKNRYSAFDIVDSKEETDPLNEKFGGNHEIENAQRSAAIDIDENSDISFCPYCGAKVEKDFEFCAKCGKKLP